MNLFLATPGLDAASKVKLKLIPGADLVQNMVFVTPFLRRKTIETGNFYTRNVFHHKDWHEWYILFLHKF